MTLDLGALVGYVTLDTLQFDRAYPAVVRRFANLGASAEGAAAGTAGLDRSLAGVAAASNGAATGLGRADKALTEAGLSASAATTATAGFADVTTQAGLAQSRLTQALLRQTAAQERYNALAATGTATTRQLAGAQATLIAATDRVTLAQERLGTATGLTSEAWQTAGRHMLVAGGVIALGFGVAAKKMAEFEQRMALVRSLIPHVSDEEMGQLAHAALTVGQAYGFSANEVADAEAELAKAGVSVKQMLSGALIGALTLAAAGQEDVASATETATIAMTQFHLQARDIPHVADLFAAGADRALGSVSDLSEAFKYGGLAASQAGFSIEETVGTLAELAQAGQIGSTAGSGLAMMLQNLVKPSDEAQSWLDRLHITLYDANGQFVSATELAGQLHDKLGSLSKAEQDSALATLFTSRARRTATILTRDGAKANQEWIDTVNAQGFAALQAAGKMDSLSGDVTKLGSALNTAFIGAGEGANGPLRVLVQDITGVVNAWNDLPAPVRLATEALFAVAGAAAVAGGAAILFIPKWEAMNAALVRTGRSAITARGAMVGLSKIGATALALAAVYEGAMLLRGALEDTGPTVEQVTADLIDMGKQGSDSADALINTLVGLSQVHIGFRSPDLADWGDLVKNLDQALTGLVTSGHADLAAADFSRISTALHDAGMSTEDITKLFPAYGRALADSANQAKLAGTGIDSYGNAVGDSAKATQRATDAAKAYSDALHALTDPLFAMNQAVQDLTDKQQAAAKANRKYGADSRQARQANLDLAASALGVETAARTLAAGVKTGTVSLHDARDQLRAWVHDGLLTEGQAKAVATSFGGLIDKANKLHPALTRAGNAADGPRRKLDALGNSADDLAGSLAEAGSAAAASFGFGFQDAWRQVIHGVHQALSNLPKEHGSPSIDEMAPVLLKPAGRTIMEGLADGIAEGGKKVIEQTHIQILKAGEKAANDAVREATKAVQAAQEAASKARSQLQTDRSARAGLVGSTADSLLGPLDLSNAVINGRVGNLSGFLKAGVAPLGKLDKMEHRLARMHLDPQLLSQIANAGSPAASIALAHSILSGQSGSIHHLNALERHARHLARSTGQTVGGQMYDRQIAQDSRKLDKQIEVLKGLRADLHELTQVAKRQSRELADAMDNKFRGAEHRHHARTS